MKDLFDKIYKSKGPLGKWAEVAEGYFVFPKLEGPISNKMQFRGKDVLVWSLNNYLGLANHPEIREVDAKAAKDWGNAYPMGARMMSGNSNYHEQLEHELSSFVGKEDTILLNYGYQGIASTVDALVDRNDVIVYDSESHACIMDGMRMHMGKRFVFQHGFGGRFRRSRRPVHANAHPWRRHRPGLRNRGGSAHRPCAHHLRVCRDGGFCCWLLANADLSDVSGLCPHQGSVDPQADHGGLPHELRDRPTVPPPLDL